MYDQQYIEHRKSKQDNSIELKSRHLIMMNQIKKKEENWNNRFYVQKSMNNQQVDQSRSSMNQYFAKLIEVQDYHNIPEFHRQLFQMCLRTLPKIKQAIQSEIEEIQLKKSHIQQCMQAIENREKCFSFLLNHIQLIQDNPQDEQLIFKSAELITHLRILSINVVESIIGWRQYLMKYLVNIHTLDSISLPYTYFNENYLIKMKKDALCIQNSVLSKFYQFSNISDPFFVSITKPTKDPSKIVQFISKPLLNRIKNIENLIEEEVSQIEKEEKLLFKQMSQKDQAKMNPRKNLQINRLRPTKRPEFSQNQNRGIIKQLDPTDFKNFNSGSYPQIIPQKQSNKQKMDNPEKQDLIKIQNDKSQNNQTKQKQLQIQSNQQTEDKQQNHCQINPPAFSNQVISQNDHQIQIQKCYLSDKMVENYLKNINDDFKKSWRGEIKQMLLQYEQQEESFCLGIYENNQLLGLGQCFLEQSLQERKLMLSHFSTADPSKFQDHLKMILQFIWNIDSCQEIRMPLYHYNYNGSFQVNKEITSKLKELNFQWKVVQSVNSETRFTIMAIRRPQESKISEQNVPIFLQHLFFTIGIKNQIQNENQFFSLSCLTNLNTLVDFQDDYINQVKDILVQSAYQFKGIKLQEQDKQIFHSYIQESFENLNEINPYNNDIEQLPEKVISSFSKEFYRWPKFKLSHNNKMIYNCFRPEKNIENTVVFMSESEEIKIFLIAADQSNTTIFIFEYEGELNFERVQQILMQCRTSIPIDQNLNIPQFTLNCKFQVQESILGIGRFSTAYRPKMMDIENVEGLIIKPPFVFGIINEDFNELTNMPNLFFRVEEQHCLQF
ncbi:unnamed protein product [Paramecium sonneborni]|uniref:Uncharacterized protein n=1 Tax=Paramecium sonneborni TaxID=65129 RepID=A0A8S1P837_9CILI|nr:unnamed protein product [Paramecium sonneborni]